jgi:hypothetical protein
MSDWSFNPQYRSHSLSEADAALDVFFENEKLVSKTAVFGESLQLAKTEIYSSTGELLDYGFGKGSEHCSVVGSRFEAAEHFISNSLNGHCVAPEFHCAEQISKGFNAGRFVSGLIDRQPQAKMATRTYRTLSTSVEASYPVGLCDPKYVDAKLSGLLHDEDDFDYGRLGSYCSNNGTAIGVGTEEAMIHAAFEVLEREAFSKFLAQGIIARDFRQFSLVQLGAASARLRDLVSLCEHECRSKILTINITPAFGVPVYCSAILKDGNRGAHFGLGCASNAWHAFERSLLEVVQVWHISNSLSKGDRQPRLSIAPLQSRALERCRIFDIGEFLDSLPIANPEIEDSYSGFELGRELNLIAGFLEREDRQMFFCEIARPHPELSVCSVILERQDPFFLITEGSLVFPEMS